MAPSSSRSIIKDLVAGLLVLLVALPLGVGIAMASGFPPVAGVLTAIIGGVVVNFLGSAQLTRKGPAVGVIAIAAVTELGQGDMLAGYRYTLAVCVVAAVIQIGLALLRAASAAAAMPSSVVHGMLAALGIMVVAKQAHTALGVAPENHAPLALLFEIPSSVAHAKPEIALIGLLSVVILFGLPVLARRMKRLERVPAPLLVVLVAVVLGYGFDLEQVHFGGEPPIGPEYLVHLPGSLLDALAFPDFSQITSLSSSKYVVMFVLVGSLDSTLPVLGKRASDRNRDLLVVGVGNLLTAALGGLPLISELVCSKANREAGATSRLANFLHGLVLLGVVAVLPMALEHLPLAALAAVLVHAGSQLVAPSGIKRVSELGWDQLVLFLVTLFATLLSDLLIGLGIGLALKVILDLARGAPPATLLRGELRVERGEGELRLVVRRAATFSSLLGVQRTVARLPDDIARVIIDLRGVKLVDHTFIERVQQMSEEWPHAELVLLGIEQLDPLSSNPTATTCRSDEPTIHERPG